MVQVVTLKVHMQYVLSTSIYAWETNLKRDLHTEKCKLY